MKNKSIQSKDDFIHIVKKKLIKIILNKIKNCFDHYND